MQTKVQTITVVTSGAQTATFSSTSTTFPSSFDEMNIYIDVTAVSGTSPSMTVTYETTPDPYSTSDASARWFTNLTTSAITATGKTLLKVVSNAGSRGRVTATITGTTPSFTMRVDFEGKVFV